ncbi:MAG: type II toxin-antitoxin system VapC family toxin [Pseudomonadota bacterium]|nr:type II toxin-antitoxin system VapC family toxin [Pseudomonadota bacterium]
MKGLDTNVLIRHLVQDDASQARLAGRFIARECSREDPCFINRIVLCETVWVLESAYGYAREDIASALERIIRTHQLRIENVSAVWAALRMYRSGGADFADCLLGETNREAGCLETATLDKKAAKTGGLRVLG